MDDVLKNLEQNDAVPPSLDPSILQEVKSSEAIKTRAPIKQWLIFLVASLVISGLFLLYGGIRKDLGGMPIAWIIIYASAWLIGFGAVSRFAIIPPKQSMMPTLQRCLWATLITCILAIGVGLAAPYLVPALPLTHEEGVISVMKHGHRCLRFGITSAILPTLLGLFLLRGVAPMQSKWVSATIGAAGGALAGCVLHFHCPVNGSIHLGLAHGGVVIVSALAALLFSGRLVPKR